MPTIVAVILGAVVGAVVGAVLAIGIVGRRRRSEAASQPNAGPASVATMHQTDRSSNVGEGLQSAVDRLAMGVVMCDASLKTTYRNAAADVLNGTHGGVILDAHLQQLFVDARDNERSERVVELQGPPKVIFNIEAMSIPRGGVVVTIDDISERVRIDSMRTDFVANISHELKTPVGAIAVLAEMLADEPDPAVVATLSGRVVDESHRAARTIDDLLELSRIESSSSLDDSVDVAGLVAEAVARGRMVADGRGVTIESTAPEELCVRADRPQLSSAIGNLVENAVKYSNDGGVVRVGVRRSEHWVEVTVADDGVGIPVADLDRVFERFYRVDKARGRQTGGTGLGLAIVRHVANNHGGVVSVRSHQGEGSTFAFKLPARLIETCHE